MTSTGTNAREKEIFDYPIYENWSYGYQSVLCKRVAI